MFKITWDRDNNGVTLTMRSTDETLNVSPRPVFYYDDPQLIFTNPNNF